MSRGIVEMLRAQAINKLFSTNTFDSCFIRWRDEINRLAPSRTPRQILDLGDHLSEIFASTRSGDRSQSDVAGGGSAWESLVCWYLNLCLIGRRTVVVKHNKSVLPQPISDAITVNYDNFISNTESDLIAISFPDNPEYSSILNNIDIIDENGIRVPTIVRRQENVSGVFDALCHHHFNEIEIHIIQCKTNWNDNAQIPMLWDMVYSAERFRRGINIGRNGYSIRSSARFTYSFVTVPTSRMSGITATSTCVKRVSNLTGGNYWGRPTESNVASSIKEMLHRNLTSGHARSHLNTLATELTLLNTDYSFFRL